MAVHLVSLRVIAGRAGGRRLTAPAGLTTRPLTDRAKEALFSSLGAEVVEARVLDLYAGSGSLGIEALSRGAASAVFVERSRPALAALRRNLEVTGLSGTVIGSDVEGYLGRSEGEFDLVFVDPPYALSLASVQRVLAAVAVATVTGGLVVLHRRAGESPPEESPGLVAVARHRYGDAEMWRFAKEEL